MRELLKGRRPIAISAVLYTLLALVTVISAWVIDLHRYDLSLTISLYVALRPWTAIVYGIGIVAMVAMILVYTKKIRIPIYRKILYVMIFLCVLGCGIFPCNRNWSTTVADLHNYCAYALMLLTTISFVVLLITGGKKQKIFAISAIAYAAYFIVAFVVLDWQFFGDTIFIWENTFIYLLLIELWVDTGR